MSGGGEREHRHEARIVWTGAAGDRTCERAQALHCDAHATGYIAQTVTVE